MGDTNLAKVSGMYGFYNVSRCDTSPTPTPGVTVTGTIREMFIAAQEVDWDYAPVRRSVITGEDLNDPRSKANIFFRDDEDFIGSVYKKAVYREYTDASFTNRKS